jgi:hypothetical protein
MYNLNKNIYEKNNKAYQLVLSQWHAHTVTQREREREREREKERDCKFTFFCKHFESNIMCKYNTEKTISPIKIILCYHKIISTDKPCVYGQDICIRTKHVYTNKTCV